MLFFEINEKELEARINNVQSWEDWRKMEKEIFRMDEWEDSEMIFDESEDEVEVINGNEWTQVGRNHDIHPDIEFLYEKTSFRVFDKLEPEGAEENNKHPELYGKWCVYCRILTRKFDILQCPKCGRELLKMPLNDKE